MAASPMRGRRRHGLHGGYEVYVRPDPKTKDVLGLTILHFEERFKLGKRGTRKTLPLLGEFTLPDSLQAKLLRAS
jgi:hypothetical protein